MVAVASACDPLVSAPTPVEDRLPLSPEEITAEWLSAKLGHRIRSITLTRGIIATTTSKLFYSLTYGHNDAERLDCPTNIVVKGGFNPAISKTYPLLVGLYRREAEWFAKVAPRLRHVEVPRAFWADWNDEQGIVIFEDLGEPGCDRAAPCSFGDPLEEWPLDLVLEGVEQLAAAHASTWGFSQETHKWLTPHYDATILNMVANIGYESFVKLDYRPPVPVYLQGEKLVVATLKKYFAERNPRFRCLLHGDPHAANVYFAHDEPASPMSPSSSSTSSSKVTRHPRFLDWQMIDVGSCFHDVSYFVVGSLSIADRRAHERRIVAYYLDALARFGGPRFDLDNDAEVWLEYQKSSLAGFAWVIVPREMQAEECLQAMLPRYVAAMDDHDVFGLVGAAQE